MHGLTSLQGAKPLTLYDLGGVATPSQQKNEQGVNGVVTAGGGAHLSLELLKSLHEWGIPIFPTSSYWGLSMGTGCAGNQEPWEGDGEHFASGGVKVTRLSPRARSEGGG